MTVLEYEDDIIIIDAGLMFPGEEMLGIDLVIPDISYLKENKEKVRVSSSLTDTRTISVALPYILPHLNVPIMLRS